MTRSDTRTERTHDLAAPAARRAPARGRLGALTVVLVALALPWLALLVPSFEVASGQRTLAPAVSRPRVGLATMLLRPSAGDAADAPVGAPAWRATAGRPTRIVVPALAVDARVQPVSADRGTLLPPSDPTSIGWWREGAAPGAPSGSAVLTGHTVHTGGGAFDDLGGLRRGDSVLVRTQHGWVQYAVRHTASYRKGSFADHAPQLLARTGPARLVLITCSQYDGTEYLANTVVIATPVGAHVSG